MVRNLFFVVEHVHSFFLQFLGGHLWKEALRRATMRLLLLVVIVFGIAICEARYSGEQDEESCSLRDPLMNPIHEVRYGQDAVWQVPRNPKGVLFFAHGHSKDPFSYFDQSPNCLDCYGLPEDRSIALEALRSGFAVIAMKSVNKSFDYVSFDTSQDLVNVIGVINDIRRENALDSSLPFAAFGSSSGGFFNTILATKIPTRALLLMTSEGLTELVENATPENFPPTFFAYMNSSDDDAAAAGSGPREMTTRTSVEKAMAILSERGVTVGGKLCLPKPIPPLYFTERLPCTSDDVSAKMQNAYKSAGWLDDNDWLVEDPYFRDWLAPLLNTLWPSWYVPGVSCPMDSVCQELLRAWAFHVTTGDANEEMFSWLDSILMLSTDDDQLSLSDS